MELTLWPVREASGDGRHAVFLYSLSSLFLQLPAASTFNGFAPAEKMYVCSVQPEFFEGLFAGPPELESTTEMAEEKDGNKVVELEDEEKKDEEVPVC